MNTTQTLADRFNKAMKSTVVYYREQLDDLTTLSDKAVELMETVVDLAQQVYEEGDDNYGYDYLSQHLTWEQKDRLKDVMDENLTLDKTIVVLNDIAVALGVMERDLQDELKFKNVGPY
jgi:hypothetical protein